MSAGYLPTCRRFCGQYRLQDFDRRPWRQWGHRRDAYDTFRSATCASHPRRTVPYSFKCPISRVKRDALLAQPARARLKYSILVAYQGVSRLIYDIRWYEGAFLSVNSGSKAAVSYDERKAEQCHQSRNLRSHWQLAIRRVRSRNSFAYFKHTP